MFAKVESERAIFDPLTDFQISFIDRQTLKQLEDKITELGIILSTMQHTAFRMCGYTRKISPDEFSADGSIINAIIEELEEHAKEIEVNRRRGEALKMRVESVTKLVRAYCFTKSR